MLKDKLIPDHMFEHYWDVTPEFLRSVGIRAILSDIDNTLAPYEQSEPDDRLCTWIADLRCHGISVALISNNHADRVELFNRTLQLPAYADSHKPSTKTLLRAMESLGTSFAETGMLGDQLLTDAYAGKQLGLRTLIVPPIHDKSGMFFRAKRLCERPFIRAYAKRYGYQPFMNFWKVNKT